MLNRNRIELILMALPIDTLVYMTKGSNDFIWKKVEGSLWLEWDEEAEYEGWEHEEYDLETVVGMYLEGGFSLTIKIEEELE